MKRIILFSFVAATLLVAPIQSDGPTDAEAIGIACGLAPFAPEGLQGALRALCFYTLLDFPDPWDGGGSSGGGEW